MEFFDTDIVEDIDKIIIYKPTDTTIESRIDCNDYYDRNMLSRVIEGKTLSIHGKLKHNRDFVVDISIRNCEYGGLLDFKVTKADAHWIMNDNRYTCSECRKSYEHMTYYCPNCGVKLN